MTNQLLQEVEEELQSKKFTVNLNKRYHGINVSIFAENKEMPDRKLFMYVLESDRALPVHIWNLHNIQEGNNSQLRLPHCEYLVYAPLGAVEHAKIASKKYGIPIFTNKDDLVKEIKKYYPSKISN